MLMDDLDVKLYYEDSYIKEFNAQVLACELVDDHYEVVLDQTAFFPESAGQYGDTGTLNGRIKVLDVKEKDGVIYHWTNAPLELDSIATGRLDFEERLDRMHQHTGEHIVSGIIHSVYGYDNVGFHLGHDVVTVDYNGELTEDDLYMIESAANQAIKDNLVVETRFPDEEELAELDYRHKEDNPGLVRLVIIPGYDVCACYAPHVCTTGEIGIIKIISSERYKGGTRLQLVAGFRALADYKEKDHTVHELSVMLSANPHELVNAVAGLREQVYTERSRTGKILDLYIKIRLQDVDFSNPVVFLYEETLELKYLRVLVNAAMERTENICVAMNGNEEDGFQYVLGSKQYDMRELSQELNHQFAGKGGGSAQMTQGSVHGNMEEIRSFLQNYYKI
ncbi:MAG: alanyl-tRNA editing protein [Lachnospiraceae bacterium]